MACTGKLVPDVISKEECEKIPEDVRTKLERYLENLLEGQTALSTAWQMKEGDYEQKVSNQEQEIAKLLQKNEIESEKRRVLQATLKEVESSRDSLKNDVAALRESVRRLDAEGIELRSQRDAVLQENTRLRSTLALNEVEIKSLQEKCRGLHSELQEASNAKYEALAKYQEVKDLEFSLQTRENEMERKTESLHKQIQSLTDDLNKHQGDLCTARREYIQKLMSIETQLATKTEECATQKTTIEDLQSSLQQSEEKVKKLTTKVEEQLRSEAKMKESFDKELAALNELVQIYKNSSSNADLSIGVITHGAKELNDLLKESANNYGTLEVKLAQSEVAHKQQLLEKEQRIAALEKELETANRLLSEMKKEELMKVIEGLSPAASAACRMLRSCGSITQFYTHFVDVKEELLAVKEENRRLKLGLNTIAEELEAKTPVLKKQKEDYEHAMMTIVEQSRQLDALNQEVLRVREEETGLKKQLSHHQQESGRLRSQLTDLAKQVCHLLREVEHARAGISSSGWNILESGTNSSQVISQNLVVFGNMEELQAQNQKLLALVREISIKEEKAEAMEEDEVALKDKVHFYEVQFKEMRDAAEGHKKLVETLMRQRDMYRSMYNKEVQGSSAAAAPPIESDQEQLILPELKKKLADTEDQLKKLQEETDSYHKERQINDKMMTDQIDKLNADLCKANDEVSKLSGKLSKYEDRFKLQESSLRAYKQQISALEGKALLLGNTLKKHEETTTYFRNKALQSEGKVASLEVQLERVKHDHSLLVGKESRLRGEHDTLRKEHEKVSRYLENLDAIRSSFERQETETTLKLQSLLEDSNRECAALRRRLQETQQQFKEEKVNLLADIELVKGRVEEEKNVSAGLRVDLDTARNSIEKKSVEIDELNKKLTEARMSPLVLRNVSESDGLKARVKDLEGQLKQGQSDREVLQKHLAEAKEQVTTFREMCEQFEKQWKESVDSLSSLKGQHDKQLSEAKKVETELRSRVKELTDRISKLTAGSSQSTAQLNCRLTMAQEELRKVQEERNALKQELEAAEKKASSLANSLVEVEQKYSQEVVFHSNDIQAVTRLKEELAVVQGQLTSVTAEKQTAEAALESQRDQWAKEQREMKAELSQLQERLSELESQNGLLHDQLEALSSRVAAQRPQQPDESGDSAGNKSAESSFVEDEINSPEQLLRIIKFLRKEKNIMAGKLSVSRSENARVKVQLERAEKQLEELRENLVKEQEKTDVSATAVAKQTELLRKAEMLYAVTDSNRILREEREALASQVKEWTEKYEAVLKELEPLKETSKELGVKVDIMTAENSALRGEAARLRQRNNFLVERTTKSNQEDWRRLQQERETLAKQLTAEKDQHQRLQEEMQTVRQDKTRLEEQVKSLEQSHADEVRKLNDEVSSVQQRLSRLQQELTDSKSQYTKKNDELAILTEELGAKEAMLNEIRSKEMTIRKIAKKYKTQYEEQIKSFEDNKKKLEELQVAAVAADSNAAESTSSLEIPEEAQERLRAEGRQNMEEKMKEVEEQHTAALKELTDQVSSSQVENDTLRKENDQLKNTAQEKDEQTKKVLKNARDKIMVLTETNKNLSESNRSLVDSNKELKEKTASLAQKLGELHKRLEVLEKPPESPSNKALLESQILKLQKDNADLRTEIQQNEERYLRDSESFSQKISQLQRQLDKQQVSKPSTSSSMAEKPTGEPPTANIKPMAGPSSSASKQSQSQQSVTVAPWPGRGETPFASIRPMSMQSRTVAVLPTQTTSSSCQQSASQSMGTVLVAPQQLVHTTGPLDGPSSSPTSSHTEFMPATSSAGPAIRQAAVQPTQQVLVAPSASSTAESTQDMEAESAEEMQQPPQVQQQQAVALVLPRVEQTISSQCSEQSSVVTASPQQASSNNNTVTTSQAGIKRPREAESEGSSSRETDKLTPLTKRTRTTEGSSQQETVTSAEGSLEVEYQVPTSSQRDQEDDVAIVDSEDEDGLADGGVVEEPDDGQEFEDDADNGDGFVVEGYEREEQELVDYDESEGPNIDNNTTEQDSNEVEVAAGEDSNEVPNQSSSVAAESDVGQSTGPEASSSEAQKSEDVTSHTSQSILPVRARSVQPLSRQQQQLLLPQGYEDAGDDSIVPSTPTLFVPRRSDGFGEAVSSPQVPQGRFTFSETNQQAGRASSVQAGPEGMDDVRMDLSHLEDAGTGRSVPTTPLQVSPQDASAEVSQGTEGDGAPPSASDGSSIPSNIPSILITQDLEEQTDQDEVQAIEVTDAEEHDAVEAHSMDQEDAETGDGGNGVSSEGEKLVAVEEVEGREAEASEVPSNSGMSRRQPVRGSGTARRSARSMFRNRGRNDRPTPIIWNEPGSTSSRGREQMVRMSMMHARAAERGAVFPRGAPRARRVRGKPKTVFTNPYHMRF